MPEYITPGIYVEETSLGPKPVQGVGTSTAGMLGLTVRGPDGVRLITSMSEYTRWYGGYCSDSFLPHAVEGFFANGGKQCFIGRIVSKNAQPCTLNHDGLSLQAIGRGIWGKNAAILVLNAGTDNSLHPLINGTPAFKLVVAFWSKTPDTSAIPDLCGLPSNPMNLSDTDRASIQSWNQAILDMLNTAELVETFDELSFDAAKPEFYVKVVNSRSCLIRCIDPGSGRDRVFRRRGMRPGNTANFQFLTNKHQTVDPAVTDDDFKGSSTAPAGQRSGLKGFAEIDEINIVYCPDIHYGSLDKASLRSAVTDHCEAMRNRIAILDSDAGIRPGARFELPVCSPYAAFYYPWIQVFNPVTKGKKLIPPGGHIAGVYARSDLERGVHKAPSNEVVHGALELEFNLTNEYQTLNPLGINVIRKIPARGIRVWGARTCSSDPEWKYINIRRLSIYIESSIKQGTQWVIFEPNDQQLWARVKQTIINFLTTVWREGALMGSTPEQAFFVDIGYSSMTQADINNGIMIATIGIAPLKPAEFIFIRLYQKTKRAD